MLYTTCKMATKQLSISTFLGRSRRERTPSSSSSSSVVVDSAPASSNSVQCRTGPVAKRSWRTSNPGPVIVVAGGSGSKEFHFQEKWLEEHRWLRYDSDRMLMFCALCSKHDKSNVFTTGCSNFR